MSLPVRCCVVFGLAAYSATSRGTDFPFRSHHLVEHILNGWAFLICNCNQSQSRAPWQPNFHHWHLNLLVFPLFYLPKQASQMTASKCKLLLHQMIFTKQPLTHSSIPAPLPLPSSNISPHQLCGLTIALYQGASPPQTCTLARRMTTWMTRTNRSD